MFFFLVYSRSSGGIFPWDCMTSYFLFFLEYSMRVYPRYGNIDYGAFKLPRDHYTTLGNPFMALECCVLRQRCIL